MGLINTLRRGVAIIGAGGAGDIVSAYVMCELLKLLMGVRRCLPVAVLWERWVLDPYPGPIPRSLLKGTAGMSACAYITPSTYVVRGGRYRFRPQASIIAGLFGSSIAGITLEYGVKGILECLEELRSSGYEALIALDVGGDILAKGFEDSLWSPLADSLVLAATALFSGYSLVGVLAPGADGELSQEYVMSRIEEVGRANGLVGSLGVWRELMNIYEKVLTLTHTEAGKAPYLALKGLMGVAVIRGGSRRVRITPNTINTYFLDPKTLMKQQPLPQKLISTKSLAEAKEVAEELGIPTELHLEIEIARTYGCGPETIGRIDWEKVRRRVKQSLKTKKDRED